jgi:hypothetical protein
MKETLEKMFADTARMPEGTCPLPEPGRGAPVIEEPHLLEVLPTEGESPDEKDNNAERQRFEELLNKLLENGEISKEELKQLLEMENT